MIDENFSVNFSFDVYYFFDFGKKADFGIFIYKIRENKFYFVEFL